MVFPGHTHLLLKYLKPYQDILMIIDAIDIELLMLSYNCISFQLNNDESRL